MAKYKFKFKKNWKSILCGVLVVVTLIGACAGLAAIFNNDTKDISSTAFERGALDSKGEYVESKKSIYTPEAFACKGLRIEPDFEFSGTYDVFFYSINGDFIESKTGLTKVNVEVHPLAYEARVVIHPAVPEGVKESEFEIGIFEVYGYAKELTITVDKDQEYNYNGLMNLYDAKTCILNKTFVVGGNPSDWNSNELSQSSGISVTDKITIDGSFNTVDVWIYLELKEGTWPSCAIFGADGKVIKDEDLHYVAKHVDSSNYTKPCWVKLTLEVPELESYEGVHLRVKVPTIDDGEGPTTNCYIFGYNQ